VRAGGPETRAQLISRYNLPVALDENRKQRKWTALQMDSEAMPAQFSAHAIDFKVFESEETRRGL
jgi:hypothetical protein